MNLFTRAPEPDENHKAAIERILSHASPPIPFDEIKIRRPKHLVSSWRSVVAWAMYNFHGVTQASIAGWLGLHPRHVHRLVHAVEAIANSEAIEHTTTREVLKQIREAAQQS